MNSSPFQELIDIVEYDDDKIIVIKFHKGLDLAIQNKVALTGDNAQRVGMKLPGRLLGTGKQMRLLWSLAEVLPNQSDL